MAPVIAATFQGIVLGWALTILSLFLILLILVQRGRGGGLTGALGGPGGQSAFGTKAGDMFTKITSVTALIWIFLCAYTMWLYRAPTATPEQAQTSAAVSAPADTDQQDALDNLMSGESNTDGDFEEDAAEEGADGDLSAPTSPDADTGEAGVPDETLPTDE